MNFRKALEWGGFGAGAVLIAFGIVAIAMGVNGRSTVRDSLKAEQIYFGSAADPAVPAGLAGKLVDSGDRARAMAKVMRTHTLESTKGQVYAEMGRFLDVNGKPTSDEDLAAKNPETGRPVENAARNLWVTETALTTALNMSYMAEQLSLFGMVVGIALLLAGIGFIVLTLFGVLRQPALAKSKEPVTGGMAQPTGA
jgi:hypothetical protein